MGSTTLHYDRVTWEWFLSQQETVEDPWAPALTQAQQRGFTREEAAMALVVLGSAAPLDKVRLLGAAACDILFA